jgi:hypothetical protein
VLRYDDGECRCRPRARCQHFGLEGTHIEKNEEHDFNKAKFRTAHENAGPQRERSLAGYGTDVPKGSRIRHQSKGVLEDEGAELLVAAVSVSVA